MTAEIFNLHYAKAIFVIVYFNHKFYGLQSSSCSVLALLYCSMSCSIAVLLIALQLFALVVLRLLQFLVWCWF